MSTASNTVQARVGREKQRYDNYFRLVAGYCNRSSIYLCLGIFFRSSICVWAFFLLCLFFESIFFLILILTLFSYMMLQVHTL